MNLGGIYLAERGLLPESAAMYGIEIDPVPQRKLCIERLGEKCVPLWSLAQEVLWFPVYNASGATVSWIARPLPTLESGPKFVTPVDGTGPPFIPKPVYAVKDKPATPLIITEGPLKAAVCTQAGFAAIGLNGVWSAAEKNVELKLRLRQDLRDFDWRGRKVYICFDADATTNPDVRHAAIRLFILLSESGAEVFQLTSWDLEQGKGIDDYLVAASKEDSTKPSEILTMLVDDASLFIDTIQPTKPELDCVVSELIKIDLPKIYQSQLSKELAQRLNVRVDDLRQVTRSKDEGSAHTVSFESEVEPWPEPVSGALLLDALEHIIAEHIIMEAEARVLVALWILLTYLESEVETLPILSITSPTKRCGKTRLMAILIGWCPGRCPPPM
jgi:hypothetical protein